MEFIEEFSSKTQRDASDMCLRLNGQLMPMPQNEMEEELVEKIIWEYIARSRNVTWFTEVWGIFGYYMGGETRLNEEYSGASNILGDQVYPPDGRADFYDPVTGDHVKLYRDDLVWPQGATIYTPKTQCPIFYNSLKYPQPGNFLNDRTKMVGLQLPCSNPLWAAFICMYPKEPTFKVRGLCKDSVMDTQYKFADHSPLPHIWSGPDDMRNYVGPKGWIIAKNKTDKRWRISHYYYTQLTITLLDQDRLPVGKHKWRAENNVCTEGLTSSLDLLISGCQEGQFTCDDGKCLEISQRCNNIEVI